MLLMEKPIQCEVGDQFVFETDGMIMETFPGQLSNPYSATKMGSVSKEEMDLIIEEMKVFNDGLWNDSPAEQ